MGAAGKSTGCSAAWRAFNRAGPPLRGSTMPSTLAGLSGHRARNAIGLARQGQQKIGAADNTDDTNYAWHPSLGYDLFAMPARASRASRIASRRSARRSPASSATPAQRARSELQVRVAPARARVGKARRPPFRPQLNEQLSVTSTRSAGCLARCVAGACFGTEGDRKRTGGHGQGCCTSR